MKRWASTPSSITSAWTKKPRSPTGSIEYNVINKADNQTVMSQTEDLSSIPNASAFLVTVEKKLPLKALPPGNYTLKLKVDGQTEEPDPYTVRRILR